MQWLQRFSFHIEHHPGRQSTKPDALSRRPDYELTLTDLVHSHQQLLHLGATQIDISSTSYEAVRLAQEVNADCCELAERLRLDQ